MIWINVLKVVLYDQRGQGLVEYTLILILVSLMTIAALTLIGNYTPGFLTEVLGSLQ